MDKDIEILKNLIKEFNEFVEKNKLNIYMLNKIEIQAIENLIKRYKELEEENRRMVNNRFAANDIENLQEEAYCKGRNDENINYKNIVENNYISKEKISEKIQKLEKYYNIMKKTYPRSLNINYVKEQIKILEELLEETNND